ncbi:hypothetical protein B0T17DRAFT_531405 [Bombardia bombarda]|uniref:Transmembrane protein n=1 Tax=Bombardia bombarda TaxID=252184 RepID=A0AA39X0B9_9PEZI|nr:hypothetical protein B0T17DRAFT_531405 [Bombardia bombarda]
MPGWRNGSAQDFYSFSPAAKSCGDQDGLKVNLEVQAILRLWVRIPRWVLLFVVFVFNYR